MEQAAYHHKHLKDLLIQNGLKLFDAVGYTKFSVRRLAKLCGVSEAAPYRHFKNKNDLILEMIAEIYRKFDRVLNRAVRMHPDDAGSQLREMACLYVKFFIQNPEYLKFLLFSDVREALRAPREAHKLTEHESAPYQTFIRAVRNYQAQRERGGAPKTDPNALVLSCWGLAHGIAVLITQNDFHFDGDCMALVRQIFWNGPFIP